MVLSVDVTSGQCSEVGRDDLLRDLRNCGDALLNFRAAASGARGSASAFRKRLDAEIPIGISTSTKVVYEV